VRACAWRAQADEKRYFDGVEKTGETVSRSIDGRCLRE
jgi:hypothetical protein